MHADVVFDPEITARQGNQAQAPEIFDTASEEGLLAILIRHDEFDRREKLLLKEGGGSMNGLVDFLKFQNLLGRHVDQDTLKNIGGCVVADRSDFPLEIIPWLDRPDLRLFRLLDKQIGRESCRERVCPYV